MKGGRFEGDGGKHEHRPPGGEERRQPNIMTKLERGKGGCLMAHAATVQRATPVMGLQFNSGNARFGDYLSGKITIKGSQRKQKNEHTHTHTHTHGQCTFNPHLLCFMR